MSGGAKFPGPITIDAPERPDQEADGQAHEQTPDARTADVTDPILLNRHDLEYRIRGAQRRARMPGPDGKNARKEYLQLMDLHKKKFPGTTVRFWDSIHPPASGKPDS